VESSSLELFKGRSDKHLPEMLKARVTMLCLQVGRERLHDLSRSFTGSGGGGGFQEASL